MPVGPGTGSKETDNPYAIRERLDALEESVNQRFDALNAKVDDLKRANYLRFNEVDQRLVAIDQSLREIKADLGIRSE